MREKTTKVPICLVPSVKIKSPERWTQRVGQWAPGAYFNGRPTVRLRPNLFGKTVGASPRKPTLEQPRLSVVMPCYGKRHLTEQALGTLLADVPNAEVVVVDNGSTDDSREWLQTQPVRIVAFDQNQGVPRALNAGLSVATGNVLVILNNDVIVHKGGMQKIATSAWETGIASFVGGIMNTDLKFVGFTTDPEKSDYPDGCCLGFRRDVWENVGKFDETFGIGYCEDTDWGFRARALGYGWAIIPDAITHLGSQTQSGKPEVVANQRLNEAILSERWRGMGIGERILVIRSGAVGDVVVSTLALAELRRQKPLARIDLMTDPIIAELMRGLWCVDRVIRTGDVDREYTSVYNLDGVYEWFETREEWRHFAYAFSDAMELPIVPERYHVPDPTELSGWARGLLPDSGYVACGLRSSTRPKVNWAESGWVGLARECPDLTFVAMDPQSKPNIEESGHYCGSRFYDLPNVVDLTGKTPTVRHLYALLKRCKAAVTVDSGMLHLSNAAGLVQVALVAASPSWARVPLSGKVFTFQGNADCVPCHCQNVCANENGHCLDWVEPKQVANALRVVLKDI